jgi:predicted phage-related endonuclease
MHWGTTLEPVIRAEYTRRTGRQVEVPDGMIRSARYPWMVANLDGLVRVDGAHVNDRVLEVKTARDSRGWGPDGSDDVPDEYFVQVQHYLFVLSLEYADLAVLIGGSEYRQYEIRADATLQEKMVGAEREFWDRVTRRDPPPAVSLSDARARWGASQASGKLVADAQVLQAVEDLREIKEAISGLEAQSDDLKGRICSALGGAADTLTDAAGNVLATWKLTKGTERLDVKALRKDHPAIAAQYTEQSAPARRLLLK